MAHFFRNTNIERCESAMKMSTIQIQYSSEKLCAIRRNMKNEEELHAALEALLQMLYEKHVPLAVRKSIEGREGGSHL